MDAPEIDLLRGDFYAHDVQRAYSWMRENEPVYHDEKNGLYALTLHEDILKVSIRSVGAGNALPGH